MHLIKQGVVALACALCLALMPVSAFAADVSVHAGSFDTDAASADSGDSASKGSESASQQAGQADSNSSASKEAEPASQQAAQTDQADKPAQSAQSAQANQADQANSDGDIQDFEATDLDADEQQLQEEKKQREKVQADLKKELDKIEAKKQKQAKKEAKEAKERAEQAKEKAEKTMRSPIQPTDKVLKYDRADIQAIGTQEGTGHSICCPSFSCAYADAVMDGTVHDHGYYTCSWCTWKDWGGGGSYNRRANSAEELLREAYDQITSGKPTVIHVTYGWGEHWVCLIGYRNAQDPDHLTLANFVALDPWDGAQVTASDRFSLYGDCCEHISSR